MNAKVLSVTAIVCVAAIGNISVTTLLPPVVPTNGRPVLLLGRQCESRHREVMRIVHSERKLFRTGSAFQQLPESFAFFGVRDSDHSDGTIRDSKNITAAVPHKGRAFALNSSWIARKSETDNLGEITGLSNRVNGGSAVKQDAPFILKVYRSCSGDLARFRIPVDSLFMYILYSVQIAGFGGRYRDDLILLRWSWKTRERRFCLWRGFMHY
jgi:hypothetical protein